MFIMKNKSYFLKAIKAFLPYKVYCFLKYYYSKYMVLVKFNKGGGDFGEKREEILHIFRSKSLLNDNKYKVLINKALKKEIRFTAQYAQDIIAYLFFGGKKKVFILKSVQMMVITEVQLFGLNNWDGKVFVLSQKKIHLMNLKNTDIVIY